MKIDKRTIQRLKMTYGDWALVTGASSGIGKELAYLLAASGFKLVITGRNEKLLHVLGTECFDKFGVETIPIPGDLSNRNEVETLLSETAHLPIGIAILNAGFGSSGNLVEADIEREMDMIDLNCKSVLQMSHYFANKMIIESRRGAIVLLSSIVAFQGVPKAANYAASKAYVQSLAEGLAKELKPAGIDVMSAAPGPVKTGFSERADMKMGTALSPKQVAVPIIKAIGRRSSVFPGFLTKLLAYNLRLLPRWGKIRVMEKVMAGFTQHQNG